MKQIKVYFESGRSTEWIDILGIEFGDGMFNGSSLSLYDEPFPLTAAEKEQQRPPAPIAYFEKYAGYVLRDMPSESLSVSLKDLTGIIPSPVRTVQF
jgi:hypothetical protein